MYEPNSGQWSRCARMEALERRDLLAGEPWGQQAKLIAQDQAVANYPSLTGAGQAIAIIDSGVDYNHPSLGGGFGGGAKVQAGWDFQSNDGNPMSDTNAHGTGAAGIAAADQHVYKGYRYKGIAPGAKIIALRENNTNGVKAALDWVLANRPKYNIVAVNFTDFGGTSALIYKDVLKAPISAGVFVSHASGNGGAGAPVGKALDPADFAVGSVNLSGQISGFTQRGAELDLLAPGERVTLPYYDVGSKKHIYVDTADGTSWASPAAVGAAALIKQIDPRFSPSQIMQIMQDSGAPVYDPATKLTYKRLNLNAALALAYQRRPGSSPQAPLPSGPIPVPPTTGQSPFSGAPVRLAGDATIHAEDFDHGGEGVSFHDVDSANLGGTTTGRAPGWTSRRRPAVGGTSPSPSPASGLSTRSTSRRPARSTSRPASRPRATAAGSTSRSTASTTPVRSRCRTRAAGRTGQRSPRPACSWPPATTSFGSRWTPPGRPGSSGTSTGSDSHPRRPRPRPRRNRRARAAPSRRSQARSYSVQSGAANNGTFVGSLDQGDWVAYKGVDFGANGATTFTASVAAANGWGGKQIQVRVGSPTGSVIGTLTVPSTGSWTTFKPVTVAVSKVTGVKDVYLTFVGGAAGNVEWFRFT